MIKVRVHFFGPLRGLVRKKQQVIFLEDGATLRMLLEELARSNSPDFQRYVVPQGLTLNPALQVFLNGENLDEIQNLDKPLATEATLDVLLASPIIGG